MQNIRKISAEVVLRKLAGAAAILIVFAGAFLVYFKLRAPLAPPLTADALFHFELHQLDVGIDLQLMIFPILLLMAMSLIPYF